MTMVSGSRSGAICRRHLVDGRCLCRDDPDVARSGVTGGVSHMEVVHDIGAARPGHVQTGGGNGLDVFWPDVDGPDLVPRFAEEAGVDRTHGAGPDDCELHVIPPLANSGHMILRVRLQREGRTAVNPEGRKLEGDVVRVAK